MNANRNFFPDDTAKLTLIVAAGQIFSMYNYMYICNRFFR